MGEITYKRKKSSYVGKKDNLANLEQVVIEHKLDEDKINCDKCGGKLVVVGTKSKEILKYKPAELHIEIEEHRTYSYACKACEEDTERLILSPQKLQTVCYIKAWHLTSC